MSVDFIKEGGAAAWEAQWGRAATAGWVTLTRLNEGAAL